MFVTETELVQRLTCPLFDPPPKSDLETAAEQTIAGAILARFQGRIENKTVLQERFVGNWNRLWLKHHTGIPETGPYWKGPKASLRLVYYLDQLFRRHRVIFPVTAYRLTHGKVTVTGEYALLERTGSRTPAILMFNQEWHRMKRTPDLASFARSIDLSRTHPEYTRFKILYFPLLRGKPFTREYPDLGLVLDWLGNSLRSYQALADFPFRGTHCEHCQSKKCMEIFDARPPGYPRKRRTTPVRN